jgi:hypothetical protein
VVAKVERIDVLLKDSGLKLYPASGEARKVAIRVVEAHSGRGGGKSAP